MIKKYRNTLTHLCLTLNLVFISSLSYSESATEDKFKDLFMTSGYATAFGAAMGAATLSFQRNPESHLRFIAVGASLGFIGGSILGTYVAFAPMFVTAPKTNDIGTQLADNSLLMRTSRKHPVFVISPIIDPQKTGINSLQGQIIISSF